MKKGDKEMNNIMLDNITKKVMEQYEQIRSMGPCNMYDRNCVLDMAERLDLYNLADFINEFD